MPAFVIQDRDRLEKSEAEWRAALSPAAFDVMRRQGTERAFSGPLHALKDDGVYICAGCGLELFESSAKFDSGTGWPSFFQPIRPEAVETSVDRKLLTTRIEVHCARCGSHLGHVFDDGPPPTGQRYCMNSVAMEFVGRRA